jgi:hypothetical protein
MTIVQLISDLTQVCDELRWISDRGLCAAQRSSLQRGAAAAGQGDSESAKEALTAFLRELDNQHGPGKPVNDNAYWLLKVNAQYLVAHM